MNGDELNAVWECRFNLNVVDHFSDALHHLIAGDDVGASFHQVCDATAILAPSTTKSVISAMDSDGSA